MYLPARVAPERAASFTALLAFPAQNEMMENDIVPKKLTQDQWIARAREKHGDRYDYSRVVYKRSVDKVEVGCPEHGFFFQIAQSHISGFGCKKCADENYSKGRVAKSAESLLTKFRMVHGDKYDYSSVVYRGSTTKVEIICRTHGSFWQTPANHTQGQGCPKCAQDIRVSSIVVPRTSWLWRFEKIHGSLYDYSLAKEIGTQIKIPIICGTHGVFHQKPQNHANGEGCPLCSSSCRDTHESLMDKFSRVHGDRYEYYLTIYKGGRSKIKIVCDKHGVFEQTPESHIAGQGCPKCSYEDRLTRVRSKGELEIRDYIWSLNIQTQHGYLPDSDNKWTFDIIVPDHKLAVEYNGVYWHSYPRAQRGQHYYKRKNAEAHGYRLITIWEDEWRDNRVRMESLLRRALLGPEIRIGARQTAVAKVARSVAKPFHEEHHIQGFQVTVSTEHYGLFDQDDLVAVASFDKQGILHRYTILEGVSISGGLPKLIKAFRGEHGPLAITTFCDRDYFSGGVYEAAGFEKTGGQMTMSYVVGASRQRRERYMKHKLPELFGVVDLSQKEIDICADNKVFACWNSGTERFELRA